MQQQASAGAAAAAAMGDGANNAAAMPSSSGAAKEGGKSSNKRKMKTQFQLEVLERVYAEDKYPSEKVRSELIGQLNLTDRQLQMWFCHRRLKDRKVEDSHPPKRQKKTKNAGPSTSSAFETMYSTSSAENIAKSSGEADEGPPEETPEMAAIRIVEEQLGEPLRDDGPILGNEFYPLPPGAFDSPIEPAGQTVMAIEATPGPAPKVPAPDFGSSKRLSTPESSSRIPREHQFIPQHPTGAQPFDATRAERDVKGKGVDAGYDNRLPNLSLTFLPPASSNAGDEGEEMAPRKHIEQQQERGRKRKTTQGDEAKLAKELEAQEKRLRKEAEKKEALRRKKEEQEKKELEKINRERKKEMEKQIREREKEEERQKREQKKENERKQKLAQKEQQRVEKLRLKEETRKVKEAAKLKAAYERATAKKLAKLATGLIDDEQLELMQMGAFVQGLVASDMDGGSEFDKSKVELKRFPPATVHMKEVFGAPPWNSENVSKFFMVWRFLTTFSDALGLWPSTVDELVQGLHDFDSRLLNEVYVALLRTLIKDVEDASQAAANGTAGSQHAIAVAAGGHPQIVEAAYTWGFDIQEWGQHLNPLTWPEILRQFALAAGYGPKWKRRSGDSKGGGFTEMAADCHNADAIATLRSGAAAVNAVALMRGGKGVSKKLRKSHQPRLTPGTVKYAAFHVLSLEGSKGLTILELTDRIQKSGLRDLSSSKTPEASISAALSRDTFLFERIAPSTYCVRSPFRRDAEESEDVIQAALEKTYLFQTRQQTDPEKEDEDEEGEDESEGDEEPESIDTTVGRGKVILRLKQCKAERDSVQGEPSSSWTPEAGNVDTSANETKMETDPKPTPTRSSPPSSCPDIEKKLDNDDDMEIDESQVGEPWVQGLMEGEFTDLSIEERLNSLVALVDVLNEGNTVRSVLEDRYEAASALKRQLWEEVQVDKRRLKESGAKGDAQDDDKHPDADVPSTSGSLSDKSRVQMKAEIRLRAEKIYVIRSTPLGFDRRHNRYWQFSTSTGGEDPGRARIYFESNEDGHWEVVDTEEALDALMGSLDTRGVREASLYSVLTQVGGPARKSMKALAQRRASESLKAEGSPSSGVCGISSDGPDVCGAIPIELGATPNEARNAMERYKELDRWVWSHCLRRRGKSLKALALESRPDMETFISCEACHGLYWPKEKHCSLCHMVFDCKNEAKLTQHMKDCEERSKADVMQDLSTEVLPSRIQLVKHLLLSVEVAIPAEAFKAFWTSACRKVWCNKVRSAASSSELLQVFTELESAVNEEWISASYETTEKALGTTIGVGHAKNLPWVPQTSSAVALRLKTFDAAIAYTAEQKRAMEESQRQPQNLVQVTTPQVDTGFEPSSSPDSGSPPDFRQNGHHNASVRGRGRGRAGPGTRGGGRAKPQRQQQSEWGSKGRGRISFRVGSARAQPVQEDDEDNKQEAESSDDGGWELGHESDGTEHSYDEAQQYEQQMLQQQSQAQQQQQQQYQHMQQQYQHMQEEQEQDAQHQQQYDDHPEQESEEEEEEEDYEGDEQQLGGANAGEEYYEVEEEDDEDEDEEEGMEYELQQDRDQEDSQEQLQQRQQQHIAQHQHQHQGMEEDEERDEDEEIMEVSEDEEDDDEEEDEESA